MKIIDTLRKLGIFKSGAVATVYKNAKDRPLEFQTDDIPNNGGLLVSNSTKKTALFIIIGILISIAAILIFYTPSAETVFKDSFEKMLNIKSLTIKQEFEGSGGKIGSLKMSANHFINLESNDLNASGDFNISMQPDSVPISVGGDYIAIKDSRYIKLGKLESSNLEYNSLFSEVIPKIKNKWLISRNNDSYSTIASTPVDALTEITPLPFAFIGDDGDRKDIINILQDEKSFKILESSKVTLDGVDAYRYELEYDKSKQTEVAEKINQTKNYLKSDTDSEKDTVVNRLELWINIETKQYIKIEYEKTTDEGTISAVITFSDYGKQKAIEKPAEYFIESELLL